MNTCKSWLNEVLCKLYNCALINSSVFFTLCCFSSLTGFPKPSQAVLLYEENSTMINQDHNPLSTMIRATWIAGPNSIVFAYVLAVMGQRNDHNEYHRFQVMEVFPNGKTQLLLERAGSYEWCMNYFAACKKFDLIPRDHLALEEAVEAYNNLKEAS